MRQGFDRNERQRTVPSFRGSFPALQTLIGGRVVDVNPREECVNETQQTIRGQQAATASDRSSSVDEQSSVCPECGMAKHSGTISWPAETLGWLQCNGRIVTGVCDLTTEDAANS